MNRLFQRLNKRWRSVENAASAQRAIKLATFPLAKTRQGAIRRAEGRSGAASDIWPVPRRSQQRALEIDTRGVRRPHGRHRRRWRQRRSSGEKTMAFRRETMGKLPMCSMARSG